jgi:hypothetical protein
MSLELFLEEVELADNTTMHRQLVMRNPIDTEILLQERKSL